MGNKKDGKRPIFTGDDLPDEAPIAAESEPVPPRWDEGGDEPLAASDDLPAEPDDRATPVPATGRLGLEDDDDRLPWLESADDIDAESTFDSGRVIGFILLSLVALAMIVGAVWFASHRGDAGGNGSLIAAESGPYKVPPEDPGGKKFAGTGDSSFVVAEGAGQPGIAGAASAPPSGVPAVASAAPSAEASASPTPKPTATLAAAATATATAAAPRATGIGVQVGAYSTAADAEKGWSTLASRHSALSGLSHRVIEGQADFGRVFRLQAVAGDESAANALCAKLRAAGQGCQVKK